MPITDYSGSSSNTTVRYRDSILGSLASRTRDLVSPSCPMMTGRSRTSQSSGGSRRTCSRYPSRSTGTCGKLFITYDSGKTTDRVSFA